MMICLMRMTKEIDEILDEYGVDEEDVIEEYLEDYYGENKKTAEKP